MLNRTMLALAAGAAWTAIAAPADAAQPASAPAAAAPKAVTRAELSQKIDADFKALDADHDGSLNKAEIEAALTKRVSETENLLKKRRQEEFQKLDANKDGQLTLAEYQAGVTITPRPGVADARLKALDTNKDGRISEGEFSAQTLAQFDRIDGNKDGTVTQQELAAAAKRPAVKTPAAKR